MEETYDALVNYIVENQDKFYRLAFSYTKNKDEAMDVVQSAICKALESIGQLKNPKAIRTWFYRIVVNESLQSIKKRDRELATELTEVQQGTYEEKEFSPQAGRVFEEVAKLPENQREIIWLHYLEELSLPEIADLIHVNENTVKSRLYAALKKIEANMEGEDQYA